MVSPAIGMSRVCKLVAIVLVAVLFMVFPVVVHAETVDLTDIMEDAMLPGGYLYPSMRAVQDSFKNEVIVYDFAMGVYYNVSYTGKCEISSMFSNGPYVYWFENPSSVTVRVYMCTGRALYEVTDAQKMRVTVPAQTLNIPGGTYKVDLSDVLTAGVGSKGSTLTGNIYETGSVDYINLSGRDSDYTGTTKGTITSSELKIILGQQNYDIVLSAFNTTYYDYYYVQQVGSGVSTHMDYTQQYSWGGSDGHYMMITNTGYLTGYPIGYYHWENVTPGSLVHSVGSYYSGNTVLDEMYLVNSELMEGHRNVRLSVLNKYLTHFNYQPFEYSRVEEELKDSIGDVQGQMNDAFKQTEGMADQAGAAYDDMAQMQRQAAPLFTRIWGVIPGWLWAVIMFGLVFTISRKVLGR